MKIDLNVNFLGLGALLRRFDALEEQGDEIMASVEEIQAKADAVLAASVAERAENQARYTDLREQIRILQEAGQPNLDGIAATLDAALVAVGDISEEIV